MAETSHGLDETTDGAGPVVLELRDLERVSFPDDLVRHIATHRTRWGAMMTLADDDPIGRSLHEYGEWAGSELEFLATLLRPGSTVLDVGSNVGTHTLAFSRGVGPEGTVVGVEPQSAIFSLLAANVRNNAMSNVRLVQGCAVSRFETCWIERIDPTAHANSGAVGRRASAAQGVESCTGFPIDALSLDGVSLMKLDVEGGEHLALRGARALITKCHPLIYFEANSLDAAWSAVEELADFDYRFWVHRTPAFNVHNANGVSENTFGHAAESNILAVPAGRASEFAPGDSRVGLHPFETLDELSTLILETPRWGDPTPDHRSIVATRRRLAEADARVEEGARALAAAKARIETLESELGSINVRMRTVEAALEDARAANALHQNENARRMASHARDVARLRASRVFAWSQPLRELEARTGDVTAASKWDAVRKVAARHRRHARETRIIRESGFFDEEHYLSQYPLADDPIQHYVRHGARDGAEPTYWFDTAHYVKENRDVATSVMNPFVHYLQFGVAEGRSPTPFFDAARFPIPTRDTSGKITPSVVDYLRSTDTTVVPSARFDPIFYLEHYPDVRSSGLNPLLHYLKWGRNEGRRTTAARDSREATDSERAQWRKAERAMAPTAAEWSAIAVRPATAPCVDVIIPVYRGYDETLRCIYTVLRAETEIEFALIVIDDASPDPALTRELQDLAGRGLFTYLRNEHNLGFVQTVNRGMSLNPGRDVILLNSDTEVYDTWIDRMLATARARPSAGTVTPLSNSATICSYPYFCEDNEMDLGVSFARLDQITAEVNAGLAYEAPSGVGFCMFIRRTCLDAVGLFDEESFGRGYGEENDFCCRAAAAGYQNLIVADVFVRHVGGASFQGEKSSRIEAALEILHGMHPTYRSEVDAFVRRDPLHPSRRRLDIARLRESMGERVMAAIAHDLGGGTEQHVRELQRMAAAEGVHTIIIRPDTRVTNGIRIEFGVPLPFPNLPTFTTSEGRALAAFLADLGVKHVHVHHLLGFGAHATKWALSLAESGLSLDYTIHDYSPICPQITLVDETNRYCGEPDASTCRACVRKNGSRYGEVDIDVFRSGYESLLAKCRRVFVPDQDVATRIESRIRGVHCVVMPHADAGRGRRVAVCHERGQRLRVAVLGGIGVHKGFDVLVALAQRARQRGVPVDFVVVGHTCDDARARACGIEITGPYAGDGEVFDVLERGRFHVSLFPAVWPETFSYTLSIALDAGLHPVAFDLGAIARRIRALGVGTILPREAMVSPDLVLDELERLMSTPIPEIPTQPSVEYALADYYDERV